METSKMETMQLCQSCGGEFGDDLPRGTNADGGQSSDYCCYCFKNGAFLDECKTVEEMIAYCAPLYVEADMFPDEATARKAMWEQLPPLKRWQAA